MAKSDVVKMLDDIYVTKLRALSDHIKTMVNTGCWTGEQAEVASAIRLRVKSIIQDGTTATRTITNIMEK